MPRLIDLSYRLDETTPPLAMRLPDGSLRRNGVELGTWMDRETSAQVLRGEAAFEISSVSFPTPVGTYIDSPFNRWPDGRDISELRLEEVILPGAVIDLRGRAPDEILDASALPAGLDVAGKAVLFNFGWDRHWLTPAYAHCPCIGPAAAERLLAAGARLFGFDTGNADGNRTPAHPLHGLLLAQDVPIVENLHGLDALHGTSFRFFAVPLKVHRATSMPVRAFAEVA
jgi:arylformamidase